MDNINKRQYVSQLIENNALLVISIFFVLLILIKIVLSINFYAPFIYMDEIVYDSLAQNLKEGKLYAKIGGSYPPGCPLFLSIAYWLANDKGTIYHIMLAISAIVTTSIIFPSYFILKKYCSTFIALIGSFAVTTLPFMNFYSFTIMTEALFIPLFLFSVWFLLKSYETNDKKWGLLASLSVVYLYMTRSNGVSMLIAFVLAFIYYVVINKKNDSVVNLIKKKSFLMGTFIIFLSSWVIFSTYVTDINSLFGRQTVSSKFGYGSSYNIYTIFINAINTLISINGLLDCFKYLINLMDYLLLSSYFLLFIAIFFLAVLFINKKNTRNNYSSIVIVYLFATILLLILSTIGFTIQGKSNEIILGRYIEPILPAIIILGIISIYKINYQTVSIKNVNLLVSIFIILVFLVLFTFMYDNTIIFSFLNFANNPAIYAYTSFYDTFYGINYGMALTNPMMNILPAALIVVYFLLFLILIYLSIGDKRIIGILLIMIIISSYFFSISIYYNEIFQSKFWKNNVIAKFIDENTNKNTLLILDTKPSGMYRYEQCVYGFWNTGGIKSIDSENMTSIDQYRNKTTYLISTKSLPYKVILSDNYCKLYNISSYGEYQVMENIKLWRIINF